VTAYAKATGTTQTLVASTVDTITLSSPVKRIQIINVTGTSDISGTISWGSTAATPTVEGDNEFTIPAIAGAEYKATADEPIANVQIKLISSGTMKYTVEGDNSEAP
jgi:hypothetical protein